MAILVLVHEGLTIKKIPLEKPETLIGRNVACDIFLDDKLASQRHARITLTETDGSDGAAAYHIEDLQSTNHTYVNSEEITRRQLVHNDAIRIGKHVFKFIDEREALADKTTKLHRSWIPGVYYTKD
jgi:pSer/pThr/pTyr-binding forkhead associated (FHA) protein